MVEHLVSDGSIRERQVGSEMLFELIELVYEGLNEPAPWHGFAHRLRELFDAKAVSITLHHSPELARDVQVMAVAPDDDTDWALAEQTYRERFAHIDLLRPERVQPGEVVVIESTAVEPDCADYFAALGIFACLRSCFSEPGGMRCWVDVVRGSEVPQRPFAAADLELLRRLSSHLARALGLYARLQRQETEKTIYADSLDHLLLGCLVLDDESRVLCANRAVRAILDRQGGIAIVQQRLVLHDRTVQRELDQAIGHVLVASARGEETDGERLVRLRLSDGTLLGLLVSPAPRATHYRGRHVPSLTIYLAELSDNPVTPPVAQEAWGASIARLFGLTPQEARLALLLAAGRTIAEAATQLGIAVVAARNYSKSIYSKLDIRGQNDLVRLVYKSFPLLR